MKKQISVLMIFSVMAAPVMAQEANKQPLKLNTDDKVQTLLTENPMKFEHQVFDVKQDKPMQLAELSQKEMKETEGAWVANAIGGVMGGVGGHFSYMAGSIASRSYNRNAHLATIAGGAALGAANPIRGGADLIRGMGLSAAGVGVGGATGYFGGRGRTTRF